MTGMESGNTSFTRLWPVSLHRVQSQRDPVLDLMFSFAVLKSNHLWTQGVLIFPANYVASPGLWAVPQSLPVYRFLQTLSSLIWIRHSHFFLCVCLWMDLGFFVKRQYWPIILSLSKIKKNSLKMYTNPLLCQQDSKMTYLNDYFVMCFCLKRTTLVGKRIVEIEEIVKSVLSNLQR